MPTPPNHPEARKRKSLFKILGGLFLVVIGLVAYVAGRSYLLLGRSRVLIAESRRFSTDYSVGAVGKTPLTYFVLGDSTAVGVGAGRLEESYPYQVAAHLAKQGHRVHVINLAHSGARWKEVQETQLPTLSGHAKRLGPPDFITLVVGANDATHRTSADTYLAQVHKSIEELRHYPKARVLIANTPDMALVPALQPFIAGWIGGFARRQNASLSSEMAATHFHLVDLYERGKLDARQDSALYAADRFHPSSKGYARWAALFIEALEP